MIEYYQGNSDDEFDPQPPGIMIKDKSGRILYGYQHQCLTATISLHTFIAYITELADGIEVTETLQNSSVVTREMLEDFSDNIELNEDDVENMLAMEASPDPASILRDCFQDLP